MMMQLGTKNLLEKREGGKKGRREEEGDIKRGGGDRKKIEIKNNNETILE